MKRFVLASGSLEDLAAAYGISYPTLRLRLLYTDGRLDLETLETCSSHEQALGERA